MLPAPPRHPKRLVFLGTPDVAVEPLEALVDAGFEISLVVTRPDKRRGRGKTLSPSPVKAAALDAGLEVDDDLAALEHVEADLGVVVAYGRIIPTGLLERVPMLNLHFSILPRWRGAAPVERAILAGDDRTGVCLMAVAPELDTGDVYRCDEVIIGPEETLDELRGRLVTLGAELLVEELTNGLGPAVAQQGEISYASKIDPAELQLDFSCPAEQLQRTVRLGRAWCTFRHKRLKVLAVGPPRYDPVPALRPGELSGALVGTGHGLLELREVQPEGRQPMPAAAWLNGAQPGPGDRLD